MMTRHASIAILSALLMVVACAMDPYPDDGPGQDLGAAGDGPGDRLAADLGAGDPAEEGEENDKDVVDEEEDVEKLVLEPVSALRPSIAAGESGFLAVWSDTRDGDLDIYGARFDAMGEIVDKGGIPIAVAEGAQVNARVAFDGDLYLVVWREQRDAKAAIIAARITRAGDVLDPDGIVVSALGGSTQFPAVASAGDGFLVAWEGPCGQPSCVHGVSAAPVGRDGTVGDALRLGPTDVASYTPAVAPLGGGYLVAWADVRSGAHDLFGRLVNAGGTEAGEEITIVAESGSQVTPSIAGLGDQAMVVWQDSRSGGFQTYGARISDDGQVLDEGGLMLSESGRWLDAPSVTSVDTGYLVAWTATNADAEAVELHARHVGSSGELGETVTAFASSIIGGSPLNDNKYPVVAGSGERAAITFQSAWDDGTTIYRSRVTADTRILDENPEIVATRVVW